MRSRAARIASSALACLALGGAGLFLRQTEYDLSSRQDTVRQFDLHAREAITGIADARAAQQAYVASGQSSSFWVPKVAALLAETTAKVDVLRGLAAGPGARQSLLDASAALSELGNIDKRARDYLTSNQPLMAGDVVFSEGGDTAAEVARHIESARLAEHQTFDADEAGKRRLEASALGGAAGLAGLVLVLLGFLRTTLRTTAPLSTVESEPTAEGGLALRQTVPGRRRADAGGPPFKPPFEPSFAPASAGLAAELAAANQSSDRATIALNAAADVCTSFGCVQELADLKRVLAQAAGAMDASGVVVWLGSSEGADLRPVVAHGYSDHVLDLMRAVPRHADNAAAAAYRTGTLQIVPAKPGTSLGAIVAPMFASDGCIGALSAEIKDNGEVSDTVHALAAIFASQLAGVLASSGAQTVATPSTRVASA